MALAGLLLFVAGLCLGPMQETDSFFRLASGDHVLRTGHLLHQNLFSFTFPTAPYLDSAWLFDVGAALVYRLGGFPAVVLAKTVVACSAAALAYAVCRRQGASRFASALLLGLAFWCLRERLVERPHLFSLVGVVAVLAFLPWVGKNDRRAWWLVAVVALWANLHAGAFLAAVMLALATLGAAIDRLGRAWLCFAVAAALAAVSILLTPAGFGIVRYLAFHVGIFDVHAVDEFRALTWRSDYPFVLFALAIALLLTIARTTSWRRLLPASGLAALTLWHVRFAAEAALALAVVAAPAFTTVTARFIEHRQRLLTAALAAVFVMATVVPRAADAARGGRFVDVRLDRSQLPLDALRFVEEHGLRERMYNDFETGSYLLWQGFPRYRVFVDPRLPAYPVAFHTLLGRMDIPRTEWTKAMDDLGVTSALVDYAGINRRASFWDPEQWALVFRASNTRVFVRRLPGWRDLITEYEIPATFDFTVENGTATRPLPTPPALSPVSLCEWSFRLGDLAFDLDNQKSERAVAAYRAALAFPTGCLTSEHERAATAWIGSIDTAAGNFAEALPLLDRALAIAPNDTAVLAERAVALTGLGRASEAREVWRRVAELAGPSALGRHANEMAAKP